MERVLAAALLAAALGGIVLFLRGDRARWRSFKASTDTWERQRRYRRWAARLWLFFALPAVAGLFLMGDLDALAASPTELLPAAAILPQVPLVSRDLLIGIAGGIVIGVAIVVLVTRLRGGRAPRQIGDIAAMLPRSRVELGLAAWLSVSAGVSEELAFRLFLPLLLAIVTGSAVAAVIVAVALFGAMHLYQGWAGVIATTVIGAVLMLCYLGSGALWLAVVLHILVDLSGLVLRPALAGAWRR